MRKLQLQLWHQLIKRLCNYVFVINLFSQIIWGLINLWIIYTSRLIKYIIEIKIWNKNWIFAVSNLILLDVAEVAAVKKLKLNSFVHINLWFLDTTVLEFNQPDFIFIYCTVSLIQAERKIIVPLNKGVTTQSGMLNILDHCKPSLGIHCW